MIGTILRDLFGAGTWGTGGNLVATVLLGIPTMVTGFVHAARQRQRHHDEKMTQAEQLAAATLAQAQAHHEDMKQHVTNTAGGSDGRPV